jgi:hypothetical protein
MHQPGNSSIFPQALFACKKGFLNPDNQLGKLESWSLEVAKQLRAFAAMRHFVTPCVSHYPLMLWTTGAKNLFNF